MTIGSILVFAEFYLPGYKGGGPVRSLSNLVENLNGSHQFRVVTRDRDLGVGEPYAGITTGTWLEVASADVYYIRPGDLTMQNLRSVISSANCNMLYFNSLFAPEFTIKPLILRRLGLIPHLSVVLAPRGELSSGALGIKTLKKRVFLTVAKLCGLYKNVIWQATAEAEKSDIKSVFGQNVRVIIAPNLPPVASSDENEPRSAKAASKLRIVFLARVARIKNLSFALNMLKGLTGNVEFAVYGPKEDAGYWDECRTVIESLPPNVIVRYFGGVEHDLVRSTMSNYDLFFLPTLGENFGHVILEAMTAGCPVLISDQTPWRNLEAKGVGWDLPLDQPEAFRTVLQRCVDMDNKEHSRWSRRAREYGLACSNDEAAIEANRALFDAALQIGAR